MPESSNHETTTASLLDATHAIDLKSWVGSANGHREFPIQNLPLGVFSPSGGTPRGGVAIGDEILDLAALGRSGLLTGDAGRAASLAGGSTLNEMMALGAGPRKALRVALSGLLQEGSKDRGKLEGMLHHARDCALHMPMRIGDYTDFYAGITHAENVGRLFRPDNPLLPNYKYVPIGYHGRSSSVQVSGLPVRRPNGQRKLPQETAPTFGPCRNLDFELEIGIWIGQGNGIGNPIPIGDAPGHVAGICLLNDWSARDIQAWEYQPLGPFLSKDFGTTVSPWIVTPEALAPYRLAQPPRPPGDPAPLGYLHDADDQQSGALDLDLEVLILSKSLREAGLPPHRLAVSNARHMYWTIAQLITHHTCNGCNLQPGDLLGSGTISSPDADGFGSLLEMSKGGTIPIGLPSGETRTFLQDGDEIILRAHARREGYASIGLGDCRAAITSAPAIVSK